MKGGNFLRVMMVLIFLLLVANLTVTAITGEAPAGLEIIKWVAFGALVVSNLCMAGVGVYFTSKSQQKHEKSSTIWGRRAFIVNGVITVLFGLAPWFFYPDMKDVPIGNRLFDVSLVLLAFGVSHAFFLYSFYRDFKRNVGATSGASGRPRARKKVKSGPREE